MTDAGDQGGVAPAGRADDFGPVRKAIQDNLAELRSLEGVVAIRPGYLFEDGWITNKPAVVLSVDPEVLSDPRMLETFPTHADGLPIDLTPATPVEQLRGPDWAAGERAARAFREVEGG